MAGGTRWLRRLLVPAPLRARTWAIWSLSDGRALYSAEEGDGPPMIFSPGFGSALRDYAPLVEMLQRHQAVIRVEHPGSARAAALGAGLDLLWRRLVRGQEKVQAARAVRADLHREASRDRRLCQFAEAVAETMRRYRPAAIDLAGHSFGTDTALLYAMRHGREVPIRRLLLLCPHPPGYLIPIAQYATLPAEEVVVVTGTRDWTRDGVGPHDRWKVVQASGGRGVMLRDTAHMDFAFPELGPPGWPGWLERELYRF